MCNLNSRCDELDVVCLGSECPARLVPGAVPPHRSNSDRCPVIILRRGSPGLPIVSIGWLFSHTQAPPTAEILPQCSSYDVTSTYCLGARASAFLRSRPTKTPPPQVLPGSLPPVLNLRSFDHPTQYFRSPAFARGYLDAQLPNSKVHAQSPGQIAHVEDSVTAIAQHDPATRLLRRKRGEFGDGTRSGMPMVGRRGGFGKPAAHSFAAHGREEEDADWRWLPLL